MSKRTPGPWYVTQFPRGMSQWGATSDLYGGMVRSRVRAVAAVTVDGAKIGEYYANARLIAAAPDLLGCLTMGSQLNTPDMLDWIADRLVAVHGENPHVDFVVSLRDRANAMRAAIAKATGAGHE